MGGHKNCRAQLRAPCTHTKQAANSWADDPSIPEEEKSRHGTSLVHICANICIFKNKMGSVILQYILYDHTTKTTIITTTTTTTPPLDNQATNHHDRDDYDHHHHDDHYDYGQHHDQVGRTDSTVSTTTTTTIFTTIQQGCYFTK